MPVFTRFLFMHKKRGGHMAEENEIIQSLKQHDERLVNLEEADKSHTARLQIVEANYTKLENTILNENRDMRTFFQNSMNKQWDMISGNRQSEDAQLERDYDLKKTRIERYSEITLKIVGAGGLLIIIAQALLQ